jgi:hypothetical protein
MSSINPRTVSEITINTAIASENGIKKGMFRTVSPKYSASLYENPTGSLSLINPEMINNMPTNILENWVMIFFIFMIL